MDEQHKENIYGFGEAINRLDEIKNEIGDLVDEAARIVISKVGRRDMIYQRANAYWISTIRNKLENNDENGTIDFTISDMEERLKEMKDEAKRGE